MMLAGCRSAGSGSSCRLLARAGAQAGATSPSSPHHLHPSSTTTNTAIAFALGSRRHISDKLFIRIVPESTTTDSLHDFFRSYGPIRDVRIVTPPREDRPPYAFVEFENVKSALAAMEEMEFRRFAGRLIFPIFHAEKSSNNSSGGVRGGWGSKDGDRRGRDRRNQGKDYYYNRDSRGGKGGVEGYQNSTSLNSSNSTDRKGDQQPQYQHQHQHQHQNEQRRQNQRQPAVAESGERWAQSTAAVAASSAETPAVAEDLEGTFTSGKSGTDTQGQPTGKNSGKKRGWYRKKKRRDRKSVV